MMVGGSKRKTEALFCYIFTGCDTASVLAGHVKTTHYNHSISGPIVAQRGFIFVALKMFLRKTETTMTITQRLMTITPKKAKVVGSV